MKKGFFLGLFLLSTVVYGQNDALFQTQWRHTIDQIVDFVSLPNDANDLADINRNIFWLEKEFAQRGFNTSVLPTSGAPLFFAALPQKQGLKTILLYMHFDGQGVDPAKWDQADPYQVVLKSPDREGWQERPFTDINDSIPSDWRLFGRSTSDDKGPIVALLNAFDLSVKRGVPLAYNIKVILDSEEEKSSAPLAQAVVTYKELLDADILVINDGPLHPSGAPTLIYGCRGITTMELTTYGPALPQHSGHYGNFAPNPALSLAQLLASMKDERGRVLIPGYYDGISISDQVNQVLAAVPDRTEIIAKNLGFAQPDAVGSFYQQSLQYPSLNIRGMSAAWVGDQARTIVPATATAALDLRLVVESDGHRLKKLVKQHIEKQGFTLLDHVPSEQERARFPKIVTVTEGSVTDAFRTDLSLPFGQTLTAQMESWFGAPVVQIRTMGGTVPIAPFVNALQIPAYIVPLVNADNNQHSPNENITLGQVAYGIKFFERLLTTPNLVP